MAAAIRQQEQDCDLVSLFCLLLLGACSADLESESSASGTENRPSFTLKSPDLQISVDADSRIATIDGVSAGRIYSFGVNENDEAAQNSSWRL